MFLSIIFSFRPNISHLCVISKGDLYCLNPYHRERDEGWPIVIVIVIISIGLHLLLECIKPCVFLPKSAFFLSQETTLPLSIQPHHPSSIMMLSYDDRSSIHNTVPGSRGSAKKSMSKVNNAGTLPKNSQGHHRHIWIITGPAGCGKTTVAKYLAENLNLPYIEGDEVGLSPLYYPYARLGEGEKALYWSFVLLIIVPSTFQHQKDGRGDPSDGCR